MTSKEYLLNAILAVAEEAELFRHTDQPVTNYIRKEAGICRAVGRYLVHHYPQLPADTERSIGALADKLYTSWDEFSGDGMYPIDGYSEFEESDNLWIYHSGELRRSMLNHMIDKLRNDKC